MLAQEKDTLYNATGRWYHLAYVYDKAAARYTLYLNGNAIWQQTYGVLDAGGQPANRPLDHREQHELLLRRPAWTT